MTNRGNGEYTCGDERCVKRQADLRTAIKQLETRYMAVMVDIERDLPPMTHKNRRRCDLMWRRVNYLDRKIDEREADGVPADLYKSERTATMWLLMDVLGLPDERMRVLAESLERGRP